MTKTLSALALVFALAPVAAVRAQDKPAAPPAPKASPTITPIKVQIVISRYQGEKKTSSMPYNLSINANGEGSQTLSRANLRMGSQVPIVTSVVDPKGASPLNSYQYRDIGTNIDCSASTLSDGRVRLEITVDDSSIYPDEQSSAATMKGIPSFRLFRAVDSMILKDGQTGQFTTASDKINGETVKVDVTLTVVK